MDYFEEELMVLAVIHTVVRIHINLLFWSPPLPIRPTFETLALLSLIIFAATLVAPLAVFPWAVLPVTVSTIFPGAVLPITVAIVVASISSLVSVLVCPKGSTLGLIFE